MSKLMKSGSGHYAPPIREERLDYQSIESQVKFLQGKVLTVVDASVTGVQNKAIKDLINQQFREQLNWLYELTHPDVTVLDDHKMPSVDVEETLRKAKVIMQG